MNGKMNGTQFCAGRANRNGNTLALVVFTFVIVLLVVGYLVMNYSQLFGVHKEATSAIDSAALAVAKDMSKAVVNTPLGRIGLVDDISAQQSLATTNNSTSQSPFKNDPRPIYSINTMRATLRLDALIASNQKINNKTMLWLIKQDLSFLDNANSLLRQQILNKFVYDKFGNQLDFQQDAYDAYTSFNVEKLSVQTQPIQKGDLTLEFGSYIGTNNSNCPTPLPKGQGIDPATEAQTNYLSYTNYAIAGLGTNVQFLPGTAQVGLVAQPAYGALGASDIPVVAKVSVSQKVGEMAQSYKGHTENKGAQLQVVGYAQAACGNTGAQPAATGTLVVTFPAGFPSGNFHDPSSGSFPELSFSSVAGIMNASQIDPNSASPASPFSRWHKASTGQWSTTINGPVPWTNTNTSGSYTNQNFLGPSSVTGQAGLNNTDPSVTMSLLVMDWLRTVGLRPSATSIINALTFDYQSKYGTAVNPAPTIISNDYVPDLASPAYADEAQGSGQSTEILTLSDDGQDDPRNLNKWNENPSGYNRQQSRMWGYVPADTVVAPDAKMAWLNAEGDVTTVDGNPASDLNDLLNQIVAMDGFGIQTFNNAVAQVKILTGGKWSMDSVNQVYQQNPRLLYAVHNASQCTEIAIMMKTNLKALTSLGVKKLSNRHFIVAGADFYPPTRAASQQELMSDKPADTGQDPKAVVRDWCAAPKSNNGTFVPSVNFYKHGSEPVIGKNANKARPENSYLPPALAATSQTSNFHQFVFRVVGGSTQFGTGTVQISPESVSPYGVVPCLKGQAHYQNVSALMMEAPNDPKTLTAWQVQARDQTVNAYPQTSNAQAAPQPNNSVQYFTDFSSGTYNTQWCQDSEGQACPLVACEWSLACPIVPPPPPPPPPPTPPAPPPPPPPTCSAQNVMALLVNYAKNPTPMDYSNPESVMNPFNASQYQGMINSGATLKETGKTTVAYDYWPGMTAVKYTFQLFMPPPNGGIAWGQPIEVYSSANPLIDNNTAGHAGAQVSYTKWADDVMKQYGGQKGWYYQTCDPKPYLAHM